MNPVSAIGRLGRQLIQRFLGLFGFELRRKLNFVGESYGTVWDHYVSEEFKILNRYGDLTNPGDEWGDAEFWKGTLAKLFGGHIPAQSSRFVEIGSGAGKQTSYVLGHYPSANVQAFDVSVAFLNILKARFSSSVEQGRLRAHLIEADDQFIYRTLSAAGWERQVDCFYSLDAMVHVDLQFLVTYWMTAARVLKPGGRLIMSVADATSKPGFQKLVSDAPGVFRSQTMGQYSKKFEWLSPDLASSVLNRLGFEMELAENLNQRDFYFVARLDRPM